MDEYFNLLFKSSLIVFPIALLLFILLKFNLIKKDQPKEVQLSFCKKIMLFSIIGGTLAYFLTREDKRNSYMDQCVSDGRMKFLNAEQKNSSCQCTHDYLYKKYGGEIYTAKNILKFEDRREMVICFLKAKKPNMQDSLIERTRKIIKNETDISSVMKEIENLE